MTRKHFEAIAQIIRTQKENYGGYDEFNMGGEDALENVAHDLANYLLGENPRFDEKRFLSACGF